MPTTQVREHKNSPCESVKKNESDTWQRTSILKSYRQRGAAEMEVLLSGHLQTGAAVFVVTGTHSKASLDRQEQGRDKSLFLVSGFKCLLTSSTLMAQKWKHHLSWVVFPSLQASGGDVNQANVVPEMRDNREDKAHVLHQALTSQQGTSRYWRDQLFSPPAEIQQQDPFWENLWCGLWGFTYCYPSSPPPSLMGSRKSTGDCSFSRQGKEGWYALHSYFYI